MKKELLGGQAIIEGVLIRSREKIAFAVRDQDGKIVVRTKKHKALSQRSWIFNIPLIRGIFVLVDMMKEGWDALEYSTNIATGKEQKALSTVSLLFTFLLSLAFALVLFKFVPLFTTDLLSKKLLSLQQPSTFALVEGAVKITVLVLYLLILSFIPDVRRIFQYHGAEHKVIHAYEHDDLAHAEKYSPIHARCGTSFLLIVILLSIIIYALIPLEGSLLQRYTFRIALLPIIAGLSYEILRLSPIFEKSTFFRLFLLPGLLVQKITTREPDKEQLQVAQAALHALFSKG